MNLITFSKALPEHKEMIFSWLDEPHMQEFWDNSQEHREDIITFVDGLRRSSSYFDGVFTYWIGYYDNTPFCLIMTAEECIDQENSELKNANISKTGKTFSIDFGIGNKDLLGKGLASDALTAFCEFFKSAVEPLVDKFLIDPDENNPRAKHVYKKAGFKEVGSFEMQGGFFDGHKSYLMIRTS
ncbi:MAG TPA: acetyltransferase [Rickettsia endosymbiont of Sericostoma sp.]|nr:acetyltransferase [Rickettsia endosymbiont of Sericostoma sp.]